MASLIPFDAGKEVKERFTDKTISELVKACFDMGEVKTGALIVIEQNELLTDYIRTGINLDAILTSQLLINIFEHNTPLHDGAVIVRENRIVAATCWRATTMTCPIADISTHAANADVAVLPLPMIDRKSVV